MIAEIKHYFAKERDEEPGDLAAGMVLDFITEKLAPDFYNQGVDCCVPVHERGHGGEDGGKVGVKTNLLTIETSYKHIIYCVGYSQL